MLVGIGILKVEGPVNSSCIGPSHLHVKRHVGVGFSMLSCHSTNCLWETQLVRFLRQLGRVVVSWHRRVENGSKLLAPHPHCVLHLPCHCCPWCRRSRFVCALSSMCGIIIVGQYHRHQLYCRHRAASSLSWPMVACSRGIVLYAGIGKQGVVPTTFMIKSRHLPAHLSLSPQ